MLQLLGRRSVCSALSVVLNDALLEIPPYSLSLAAEAILTSLDFNRLREETCPPVELEMRMRWKLVEGRTLTLNASEATTRSRCSCSRRSETSTSSR